MKSEITAERNKVESLFCNIIYILTVIGLFFVNRDPNEEIWIISVRMISFAYILILILLLLSLRLHFSHKELIIIMFLFVVSVLISFAGSRGILHFALLAIYMGVAFFVVKRKASLNKRMVNISLLLIFISFVIQLSTFRFHARPVLSIIDPNFSGFYIFLVFLLCRKMNMKMMSYVFLFMGALTLSRNFYLAVFVFFLFTHMKKLCFFFLKLKFVNVVIFSHVALLIMGFYFVLTFDDQIYYDQTLSRIAQVEDRANFYRFSANIFFWHDLLNSPFDSFYGREVEEYAENVFAVVPHNVLFKTIMSYGLFVGIVYLLCMFYLFKLNYSVMNMPYIISLLMYFLFLGAGAVNLDLVFIFIILSINSKDVLHFNRRKYVLK